MEHKKIMAVAVAATMLIGSTVTVFADDATGATGTGTSFDHVNKEVTSVKLPTTAEVTDVFNYYVDPERLINDAGKLADGTTAVTGNEEGVYFKHAGSAEVEAQDGEAAFTRTGTDTSEYTVEGVDLTKNATYTYDGTTDNRWEDGEGAEVTGISVKDGSDGAVTPADGDTIVVSGAVAGQAAGAATYSSTSEAVTFEGRNSVDVDISVKAEIKEADAKTTDIALVADADALAAATGPALLMQLKVGSDTKAITSAGTTASDTIEGKPTNFAVTTDNGKYVYGITADASGWDSKTVQLTGKTNKKDVPDGANAMTAPKITLTWTVGAASSETGTAVSAVAASGDTDVLVRLVSGVNADASKITSAKVNGTDVESSNIAVSGSGNVWLKNVVSAAGEYKIVIVYDGVTYTGTYTKP